MKIVITAIMLLGIVVFTIGATETKHATWESTYVILTTFNGQQVRIRKSQIIAYKYNPKWDYTDLYASDTLLEIREMPEEIDELLGRKDPSPQEVEPDTDAKLIEKIDGIMKQLEPRYKSGDINGSMAMTGLAEAKQYIEKGMQKGVKK